MRGEEQVSPTTTPPAEDIKYIPALAMLLNSVFFSQRQVEMRDKASGGGSQLEQNGSLTLWQPNDMPKRYKDAVDTKKIDKLLGVEERGEIKRVIFKLRQALEHYLKSDYSQNGFKLYLDNEAAALIEGLSLFEGRRLLTSLLALLAVYPEDKDRFLALPQRVFHEPDNSSVKVFLKDIDEGRGYPVYFELLDKDLKLDYIVDDFERNGYFARRFARDNDGWDLAMAVRDMINGITEQMVRLNYSEFKPRRITNFIYMGHEVIQVARQDFDTHAMREYGRIPELEQVPNSRGQFSKNFYRIPANKEQLAAFRKRKTLLYNNQKFKNLEKFFNSGGFKGALAGLELISLIIKLSNEDKKPKDIVDIVGSGIMLTHYSTEWRIAVIPALKDTKFAIGSRFLGYAGAAIGVGLAVWDAINMFNAGDNLAGKLSLGLAGANLVLLGLMFVSAPVVPIMIVIAFIIVLSVLISIFKDDSMESFLKNNIIGSNVECPPGNLRPAEYMRLLYDRRAAHAAEVNERFEPYFDPWQALVHMNDFLPTFSSELLLVDPNAKKVRLVPDSSLTSDQYESSFILVKASAYIPRFIAVRTRCDRFIPGKSELQFSLRLGERELEPWIDNDILYDIRKYVNPEGAEISTLDNGRRHILLDGVYYIDLFYTLTNEMMETIEHGSFSRREFHFEARLIEDTTVEDPIEQRCWPMSIDGRHRRMRHSFDGYSPDLQGRFWKLKPTGSQIIDIQQQ
jgi:hypothetical protein